MVIKYKGKRITDHKILHGHLILQETSLKTVECYIIDISRTLTVLDDSNHLITDYVTVLDDSNHVIMDSVSACVDTISEDICKMIQADNIQTGNIETDIVKTLKIIENIKK